MIKVDIFISHAWRVHPEWESLVKMIDSIPDLTWRNFSVPWHDPALRTSDELGLKLIEEVFISQIIPSNICLVILDLLKQKSSRRWIEKAIFVAKENGVPVVAIYTDQKYLAEAEELKIDEVLELSYDSIEGLLNRVSTKADFKYV